jgi:hypothetical protein
MLGAVLILSHSRGSPKCQDVIHVMTFRAPIAALFASALLARAPVVQAQSTAPQPQAGIQVGQLRVSGPGWNFSGSLPGLSQPFTSATITNTNCTRPFLPGTAQAGAVIFTAVLTPFLDSPVPLQPFRGSSGSGQIRLTDTPDGGGTGVTASLTGLEPFVQGTTLSVCLTAGPFPPVLADVYVAEQRVAASNFDVTGVATASTDSFQPLIGISGTQSPPDGSATRQQVFFFSGDLYLGTDTLDPSLAPLQLVGSPGPSQLDVSYADPDGGPDVTVTYTLAEGVLTPNGTPPGH